MGYQRGAAIKYRKDPKIYIWGYTRVYNPKVYPRDPDRSIFPKPKVKGVDVIKFRKEVIQLAELL